LKIRHSKILSEILKNGLIMNKKAYEFMNEQIYNKMLQYFLEVSHINLCKKTQLTKFIYILFNEIEKDKIM